jgi:preprotein translocase subunit SecG
MLAFIGILAIIISILLILVVLVQNPKGGGISSNFGAPGQLGGVKRANDFIEKATWSLAGGLAIISLIAITQIDRPKRPAQDEQQEMNQPADGQNQPADGQGQPAQPK